MDTVGQRNHRPGPLSYALAAWLAVAISAALAGGDELAPWGLPEPTTEAARAVTPSRRAAFWCAYDPAHRVPLWCAFKIDSNALRLPPRRGQLADFHATQDGTYPRMYANSGFARGHIVPYAVLGGDYDFDGLTAADGDTDDEIAIVQANTMDNIAPQDQAAVNGAGGTWYALELFLRDLARREGEPVYVVAGTVLGAAPKRIGDPVSGVAIPAAFFQVALWGDPANPRVLAVLVPHFRQPRPADLGAYCVPVDVIEGLIGWNLLPSLDESREAVDTYAEWQRVSE